MRNIFLAAAIMLLGTQIASATDILPLVRTCTIAAPAEKGQPQLVMVDSNNDGKVTTYIQINGPTILAGPLDAVTISVEPFDATITTKGIAPKTNGNYVRVVITEGWASLLDRIRKGHNLSLATGNETITISLKGSGAAIAALERCTR